MRLISLRLAGFRRFEDAVVDFDSPVVALVGPNEAGKTTVLRALQSLEESEPIERADFTRGSKQPQQPNDEMIVARYVIEEDDRAAIAGLGGVGNPRWFILAKNRDGSRTPSLDPGVHRDRTRRVDLAQSLGSAQRNTKLKRFLDRNNVLRRDEDNEVSLRHVFKSLASVLDTAAESLPEEVLSLVEDLAGTVDKWRPEGAPTTTLNRLKEAVSAVCLVERSPHPQDEILDLLDERRPAARFFSDGDRQLDQEYNAASLGAPPPALANLLRMAGVTGQEIARAISSEFHHERLGLQQKANAQLKERFTTAWQQAHVYPVLHFEEETVRIHVPSRGTLAPIAERSDGLRVFVALIAFTDRQGTDFPPILLVDEAERHLHYDAQADLVRVFENQRIVPQIIYTTHSAGCLPSDLGVGVRAVQPTEDSTLGDTARSTITSAFWAEGAGFSPLLFAMGANVLAFAPARAAVLTEGRSDPIILPSLLREASKRATLGFQVAPGIATISPAEIPDLDLEAPRIAYLLDGDAGGKSNARKLRAGGVPKDLVFTFANGRVLEDFIAPDVYLAAVNEELRRSHGSGIQVTAALPSKERPAAVRDACAKMGVPEPNKARVTSRVLEHRSENQLLDPKRRKELAAVLAKLDGVLRTA